MKVNYSIVVDDTFRGRLRARIGRSGLATRKEIRIWIGGLVNAAGNELPQPKTRPSNTSRQQAPAKPAVDPATVCLRCGRPYGEHGTVTRTCPLNRKVKPGSTFQLTAEGVL